MGIPTAKKHKIMSNLLAASCLVGMAGTSYTALVLLLS